MPMEERTYEAKTGFNGMFNIVENCQIVVPPYNKGKIKDEKFFFSKRPGILNTQELNYPLKKFGSYSSSSENIKLALTDTYLFRFTDSTNASIGTPIDPDSIIFSMSAAGGTEEQTGTATGGGNPVGGADAYLEDTSASWTTDQFAGMYLWLTGGKGVGDIQYIKGNTDTKIEVEGWTNANQPDATTTFKVFTELVDTVIVSSKIGAYVKVFDGTDLVTVSSLPPIRLSAFYDSRFWYTTEANPNIVFYSEVGQYFIQSGFIVTGSEPILSLDPLGDYLITGKVKKIAAINKISDSSGVTVYKISDLVEGIGVFSQESVEIWRGGYYFVADDLHGYTLSISVSSDEKLIGTLENITSKVLGGYITAFPVTPTTIHLKSDAVSLSIFYIVQAQTYEFRFMEDYEGWLVNVYLAEITSAEFLFDKDYYAISTAVCSSGGDTDLGADFTQSIGFLLGTENIFSIKMLYFVNVAVEGSDQEELINVRTIAYGSYLKNEIDDLLEFEFATAALGESVIGEVILGGASISTTRSDIFLLKKQIQRAGNFFQVVFYDDNPGGFSMGDVQAVFLSHSPVTHGRATTS